MAIDWYPGGPSMGGPPNLPECWCQNACKCMFNVGSDATTITRDSAVDALPEPCPVPGPGGDMMIDGGGRKLKSRKAHK